MTDDIDVLKAALRRIAAVSRNTDPAYALWPEDRCDVIVRMVEDALGEKIDKEYPYG